MCQATPPPVATGGNGTTIRTGQSTGGDSGRDCVHAVRRPRPRPAEAAAALGVACFGAHTHTRDRGDDPAGVAELVSCARLLLLLLLLWSCKVFMCCENGG